MISFICDFILASIKAIENTNEIKYIKQLQLSMLFIKSYYPSLLLASGVEYIQNNKTPSLPIAYLSTQLRLSRAGALELSEYTSL